MDTSSALGNLPPQLTVFIGREAELAELRQTLLWARLVTLTGAGGTGKTRLAIEAAARAAAFGDGVWWVDLSQVDAERLVSTVTAAALPFVEAPYRDARAALVEHLRPRRALLLLDNCEHVLEEVAALVDGLLRACPDRQPPAGSDGGPARRAPRLPRSGPVVAASPAAHAPGLDRLEL
jgi:NB-ARC domain